MPHQLDLLPDVELSPQKVNILDAESEVLPLAKTTATGKHRDHPVRLRMRIDDSDDSLRGPPLHATRAPALADGRWTIGKGYGISARLRQRL